MYKFNYYSDRSTTHLSTAEKKGGSLSGLDNIEWVEGGSKGFTLQMVFSLREIEI